MRKYFLGGLTLATTAALLTACTGDDASSRGEAETETASQLVERPAEDFIVNDRHAMTIGDVACHYFEEDISCLINHSEQITDYEWLSNGFKGTAHTLKYDEATGFHPVFSLTRFDTETPTLNPGETTTIGEFTFSVHEDNTLEITTDSHKMTWKDGNLETDTWKYSPSTETGFKYPGNRCPVDTSGPVDTQVIAGPGGIDCDEADEILANHYEQMETGDYGNSGPTPEWNGWVCGGKTIGNRPGADRATECVSDEATFMSIKVEVLESLVDPQL